MLLGIYSYDAHYIEGASDPPPLLPGRAFPQPCRCAHPLLEPSTHAGFKSVLPCQLSLFAFQSLSSEAWGSGCLPNLVCQLGRGAVLGTRHRLFIKTDVLACVVQGPRSATPPCPPPPRGFSHDGNSARLAAQFLSSFPEAGGGTGNGAVLAPACLTCYCSCHPSHTSWPGHETGLPPESPAGSWSLGLVSPTLALLQTEPSLDSFCFASGRCGASTLWQSPPVWVWVAEGRGPGCCCRLLRGYLCWQVPRGSGELVGATAGARVNFVFF